MIVGIYVENGSRYVGGGYVYQKCLFDAIVNRQAGLNSTEKIIFFYKGETELINDHIGFSVNTEWYDGKLNEAAMRHHVDIMWFLSVAYEEIEMPHIIPVWDLQHRLQTYFPEVSSGGEFISRDGSYGHFLPRATYILTGTEEGKKEISFFYRIPPDRIIVNPLPLPQESSKERIDVTGELTGFGLHKDNFLFYPAQFWPHKNHMVLLETIKILKSEYDLDFKLVFTGSDHGNRGHVLQKIADMGLKDDVLLLGFVSTETILWLYQNALALVYPSFFGPDNIPPLEAFSAGCPVVAARVSGADEQLGDAAILVDPQDESGFASAVMRLAEDSSFRNSLIQKGYDRVQSRTAESYVENVFDVIARFSKVRRCWGAHYMIKYTPGLLEWLNSYLRKKEIHSLITLLSICTDPSLEESRDNIAKIFDRITSANKNAEAALARRDFAAAFEMLNNILLECIDYAPVYLNLAHIFYIRSDVDKAFEYTKKAHYYNDRLRTFH